jgi:hypothetical protein
MRVFGMKTAAAKAKGRRLQQWFRDKLIETLEVPEDDVRSTAMGQSGEDILMSKAARDKFPFSIECKNQEKLNLWAAWEQANSNKGIYHPLLVVKRNGSTPLVVLEADTFMELVKNNEWK